MKRAFKAIFGIALIPTFLAGCSSDGDSGGEYIREISTAAEFYEWREEAYGTGNHYKAVLTADIDLNGASIESTAKSTARYAILDGKGHIISNFKIVGQENAALFSKGENFDISNVIFKNVSVTGTKPAVLVSEAKNCKFTSIFIGEDVTVGDGSSDYSAGLVAKATGKTTFDGCTSYANVKGGDYVGGIVAYLYNSSITNCSNVGNIVGYKNEHVGGVVGHIGHYNDSSYALSGCMVTGLSNGGKVDGKSSSKVGGVVGSLNRSAYLGIKSDTALSASNLFNDGEVSGKNYVGGIFGYIDNTCQTVTVSYADNAGIIKGDEYVAGIVGFNKTNDEEFASCRNFSFQDKTGTIEGKHHVAGISANGNTFTFCSNFADIRLVQGTAKESSKIEQEGQIAIGGIVGTTFDKKGKIENCGNYGKIEGYAVADREYKEATSIGGLAGIFYGGTIKNNKVESVIDGKSCVGGLVGAFIPNFETSISGNEMKANIIAGSVYSGGLIGYVRGAGSNHKMTTIIDCKVGGVEFYSKNQSYSYGANFGGLIGYASVGTTTSSHFETIKISDTEVNVRFFYKVTASEFVGFNEQHSSGKYCVVLDDSVTSSADFSKLP